MEEGSNILNQLKESSKELYEVPEGYFESFPAQMLEKVKAEPATRVIPFGKRFFRYAAAAVVAGIITLGAWLWIKKPADPFTASQADKNVLQKVQQISDSEIAAYVENSALTASNEKIAALTDIDVNNEGPSLMLIHISDEELQQYLEEYKGSKPVLN